MVSLSPLLSMCVGGVHAFGRKGVIIGGKGNTPTYTRTTPNVVRINELASAEEDR